MTHLVFFEKPGCGGNARQRAALQAAGHTLERRDLLSEPWTAERLRAFLAPLPVADWFNRAAPRVKSAELLPEQLDAVTALACLLAEPLLIRRPLMQRTDTGACHVGFETAAVAAWLGAPLTPVDLPSPANSPVPDSATIEAPVPAPPQARHSLPRSLEGCASPLETCPPPPGDRHAAV